tara:strand:- start:749 stop:1312 length:564 start_codon:yes stop_codon:yes gene_type:complete
MSHNKDKAYLINIGTDPNSVWAMLSQNMDIDPCPEIYNQEPGLYNMTWKTMITEDHRVGIQFDLFNSKLERVDTMVLPAMQYFSGQLVSMRASGVFEDMHSQPAVDKLKMMFPQNTSRNPMSLVNAFMQKQNIAFQEKMNEWANFKEHDRLLANMYIMIGGNLPMLESKYLINEDVVCLPNDDDLTL